MPRRLALVEDDARTAALVAEYLRREGFEVAIYTDGDQALRALRADPPDIAVLDWMLPGMDGVELCRALRSTWQGPVLMLTARTDDIDEVVALEVGADDWLAKPVRPRVLLAHLRALLRRAAVPATSTANLTVGKLVIDARRREVRVDETSIALTTAEFELLSLLAVHAGAPITREDLFQQLRGIPWDPLDRSMDMRVSQLRKRLRAAIPDWEDPIRSVRGTGYQLVAP